MVCQAHKEGNKPYINTKTLKWLSLTTCSNSDEDKNHNLRPRETSNKAELVE